MQYVLPIIWYFAVAVPYILNQPNPEWVVLCVSVCALNFPLWNRLLFNSPDNISLVALSNCMMTAACWKILFSTIRFANRHCLKLDAALHFIQNPLSRFHSGITFERVQIVNFACDTLFAMKWYFMTKSFHSLLLQFYINDSVANRAASAIEFSVRFTTSPSYKSP